MGKHSEWRKLAKKLRRKRLRQASASARHQQEEIERQRRENSPSFAKEQRKLHEQEVFEAEEEARQSAERHARWLAVEEEAQRQWQELQKKLKEAREERARQNELIKLEWEREQQRLRQIKEQKERELEEKRRQQELLDEQLENFLDNGGDTPEHLKSEIHSNPTKPPCPFFAKTAACRFREMCSRNHIRPTVSRTLLMPGFFTHYSLEHGTETEHGDSMLEFENDETYSDFREFFFDVLPELERFGRIRQFKVCSNLEPHLRGNVYVEYSSTREAIKSYRVFNGRWYGGKQLSVEFCTVRSWKAAICGLHFYGKCPKGSSCNFMHVFRNPSNMFNRTTTHDERESEHRRKTRRRRSQSRERSERRDWRWSESPERFVPIESEDRRSYDDRSSRRSSTTSESLHQNNGTRKRARQRSRSRSSSRQRSDRKKKDRRKSRSRSKERNRRRNKEKTDRQ